VFKHQKEIRDIRGKKKTKKWSTKAQQTVA